MACCERPGNAIARSDPLETHKTFGLGFKESYDKTKEPELSSRVLKSGTGNILFSLWVWGASMHPKAPHTDKMTSRERRVGEKRGFRPD